MSIEIKTKRQKIIEKIQQLIEWSKNYPLVQVSDRFYMQKYLKRYCHSEDEYQELSKQYEKTQRLYKYVRVRKSQGRLTTKQEEMCREGNIRGMFGYPTRTKDLSKTHGLVPEKIDYIISKYGSIDEFVQKFRNGQIDKEDKLLLSDNLTSFIDINKSRNINIINFVKRLLETIDVTDGLKEENYEIRIFDSSKIDKLIDRLEPNNAHRVRLYFGLYDGKTHLQSEIAQKLEIRSQAISGSINKSLRFLARIERNNPTVFVGGECYQYRQGKEITSEQRMRIDAITKKIYDSNLIFIPDEGLTQDVDDITTDELNNMAIQIKKIREDRGSRQKYTHIEKLELSNRIYNALLHGGITTIEQLKYITLNEIASLSGMGYKSLKVLQQKVEMFKAENEQYFIEDHRELSSIPIDELSISDELFYALKEANINTVAELVASDQSDLEKIMERQERETQEEFRKALPKIKQRYKNQTELQRLKELKEQASVETEKERKKAQKAAGLYTAYNKLSQKRAANVEKER